MAFYDQKRNVGLAAGSLVMVVFPFPFGAWSLVAARTLLAASLLGAMAVVAVALIVSGIAMIREVRRLPHLPMRDAAAGRKIRLQFWAIVAAEYVGIAVVCMTCGNGRHWMLIPPLIDILVGLHFLPLARLFKVPRYNIAGALFCLIPLATMLSMPSSAHVGHALVWFVVPPVGCSLVGLATAWAGLNEVRRFLGGARLEMGAGASMV